MRKGVDICNDGAGRYTGRTNDEMCVGGTGRVECCYSPSSGSKAKEGNAVKWANLCYGNAHDGRSVCKREYGKGYTTTGNKKNCSSITFQWECTKI